MQAFGTGLEQMKAVSEHMLGYNRRRKSTKRHLEERGALSMTALQVSNIMKRSGLLLKCTTV